MNTSASTSLPVTQAPDENSASNEPSSPPITARQLVAPGALMGTGPSSFSWSPFGATLAYVEPQDGQDVLWAYDPVTGEKRVLLDPGDNPDRIDLPSAQWSPQGDVLLLAGGDRALAARCAKPASSNRLAEGSGRNQPDLLARRNAHCLCAGQ